MCLKFPSKFSIKMASFTFRGIMAPVILPTFQHMEPDLEVIPHYAKYLKEHKIEGVCVNDGIGEGPNLTINERKAVAETWKAATLETEQHLMVQVGGAAFPDVLELAEHAGKIGVDSILCLPDLYYIPHTISDLIEYLKRIAAVAPKTPLFYYHHPSTTRVILNMEELVKEINTNDSLPTFCGLKFVADNLEEGRKAEKVDENRYTVFLSVDDDLANILDMGFGSVMPQMSNMLPGHASSLYEAYFLSHRETCAENQKRLSDTFAVINKAVQWPSRMKYAMSLLSPFNVGRVRFPLKNVSGSEKAEMRLDLRDLGHHLHLETFVLP